MKTQKITLLAILTFFLLLITLSTAYADSAVYIVQNPTIYDTNMVSALEDMGYSIDIVDNEDVGTIAWGSYKFMLVGDHLFSNDEDIPVNDFPAIIVNSWHMNDWHWAQNMGLTSSSQPMQINIIDSTHYVTSGFSGFVEVYDTGSKPMYYLSRYFRSYNIDVLAAITTNSADVALGVVEPGTVLRDGEVSTARSCWLGFSSTNYWTADAETLFKNCADWVAYGGDADSDTIRDDLDNCVGVSNPSQTDGDGDGAGDACDNCNGLSNPAQGDLDLDNIGDACDTCPNDPLNDADSDGVCGDVDVCEGYNDFLDVDSDSIPDGCDACMNDANNDEDADLVCGDVDNCPTNWNPTQDDADSDGLGDACDNCINDPGNDEDWDAVCGDTDNCPTDWNPGQEDLDLDGIGDVCDAYPNDYDNDGVDDVSDNCPTTYNPTQTDSDSDGLGDVCDTYPNDYDNDGVDDVSDNCVTDFNPGQEDLDLDGIGDVCDTYPDDHDNDGYSSGVDCDDYDSAVNPGMPETYYNGKDDDCNGATIDDDQDSDGSVFGVDCDDTDSTRSPDYSEIPNNGIDDDCNGATLDNDEDQDGVVDVSDNCVTDFNPGQEDLDLDGIGDLCDTYPNDYDNDGVDDGSDNCYDVANPGQSDVDGDGIGDACDAYPNDHDNDGVDDGTDNCVIDFNPGQEDLDLDGMGDVCDPYPDDYDNDGVVDGSDNCYDVMNPAQTDSDSDGIGDLCDLYPNDYDNDGVDDGSDNCYDTPNPGQEDLDLDGMGDVCDTYPDDHDNDGYSSGVDCDDYDSAVNPGMPEIYYNGIDDDCNGATIDDDQDSDGSIFGVDCDDTDVTRSPDYSEIPNNGIDDDCNGATLDNDEDQDGVVDGADNCVIDFNPGQEDLDGDNMGDVCDPYPNDYDNDGVDDGTDNCALTFNPTQTDTDGDGFGDVCDTYPNDYDNDGVEDSTDNCPVDPNPAQTDSDSDGIGDVCDLYPADYDNDGVDDSTDNCVYTFNPGQEDVDSDGIGDVCDTYPNDHDNDGVDDGSDNCVIDYNPTQLDTDGDGMGDACDAYPDDFDNDGVDDASDNCPLTPNPGQEDVDSDGIGDICDSFPDDFDNDGVVDASDNCIYTPNPGQEDVDSDGIGDVCDTYPTDHDNDGVDDGTDNCVIDFNPGQEDSDGDGMGDVCDPYPDDYDNDGVDDGSDNCYDTPNPLQEDLDGDGIGDACDAYPDDYDNDGFSSGVDCDDFDDTIYPGATEIMDSIDQNCVNDAPVLLSAIPDQTWDEDTLHYLDLSLYFGDYDGDALDFDSTTPARVSISIVGSLVEFDPNLNWVGTEPITFTASDLSLSTDSNSVLMTVEAVNDAPTLAIPDQNLDEGTFITLNLDTYSDDVEFDSLSYVVVSEDDSKVDCDVSGNILTITAIGDFNGVSYCGVTVSDYEHTSAIDMFDITVDPVNDAPVVSPIPDVTFSEGSTFILDLNNFVEDIDNADSSLSWTVIPDPATLEFDVIISPSNVATFHSVNDWNGVDTIELEVCDLEPLCDSDFIQVTITPTNDAPVITTSPVLSATEDSPYYYDVDATDADLDTLVYSLNTKPTGMSIDSSTGEITWLPLNEHVGSNGVVVVVDDLLGGVAQQTFSILVENTNDVPYQDQTVPDQEWQEDTILGLNLDNYFEDMDVGDVLAYTSTNPADISVNIVGNTVTLTPDQHWHGVNTITFTATDLDSASVDSNVVTLTVTPVNDDPVLDFIDDVIVTESDFIDINPTASDTEGDPLTFHFDVPLDINGEWQTDFDDSGVYLTTVAVTDGNGGEDSQQVYIQVLEWGNHQPVLDHIDDIIVTEGELVDINPTATDLDHDQLTFTFSSPIGANGEWQTDFTDSGDYDVTVEVHDGAGGIDSQQVHITVIEWGNHAPVLEPISDVVVIEGELVTVVPVASDLDEDSLTFTFGTPLDINGEWQTTYTDAGVYPASVGVSDGDLDDVVSFTIYVLESGNHNPVMDHIDDVTVTEGDLVDIDPVASDPDSDPVEFIFELPLDSNGEWQTDYTNQGTYVVTVTAWDGTSGFDSQEVTINVIDWGNHEPVLNPIADITVMEGELVSVSPVALDVDGDVLVFEYANKLDTNGEWQTNYMDAGTYTEVVTVRDGRGGSDTTSFTIDVLESGNHAPILQNIGDITVIEGELVEVGATAYDPDGDSVEITFSAPLDSNGKWQTEEHETGVFEATITASDGDLSVSQTIRITVLSTPVQGIGVSRISMNDNVRAGDLLEIVVTTQNTGTKDIKNMKVKAIIYEFGAYGSTRQYDLKIGKTDTKRLYVEIPEWAEPGDYEVRLTISSDEARRVKHRPITVLG